MSRTFQDRNFLVWEVYSSGGDHGFPDHPHAIFHCRSQLGLRPRAVQIGADQVEARRIIHEATDAALMDLLDRAEEID